MPRDLADVLHYFLPELERPVEPAPARPEPSAHAPGPEATGEGTLPLASIAIADTDLVRAGLLASLASEVGRLGGQSIVLTPATANVRSLFAIEDPRHGEPNAMRVEVLDVGSLHDLATAAIERATALRDAEDEDGVVLTRIPPAWLAGAEVPSELFEWLLLFSSPHERNLSDAYALATRALRDNPEAEIGVTIHGASGRREGEAAFGLLARSVEQQLGRTLANYGLLLDDLDVYRSLVAGQPIGRAHPDSPASAALREAAKLVFERARKTAFH